MMKWLKYWSVLSMSDFNIGQRIKKIYPYSFYEAGGEGEMFGPSEWWQIGCKKTVEQYGEGYGETFYHANGEGYIDIEILAIVYMPRKIKKRVLYKFDQILPDGTIRKSSKIYTVSIDVFKNLVDGQAYRHEYTVEDDD